MLRQLHCIGEGVNYDFATVLGGAISKSISFAPPEKISHHATGGIGNIQIKGFQFNLCRYV